MGLILASLLATTACSSETTDHVATCTVLGGLVGEHLLVELDCPLEPTFLVDFGVACAANEPTEEEALGCLEAVYALERCPDTLPAACLLFAPGVAFTTQACAPLGSTCSSLTPCCPGQGTCKKVGQGSTRYDWQCAP